MVKEMHQNYEEDDTFLLKKLNLLRKLRITNLIILVIIVVMIWDEYEIRIEW